MPPGNSSNELNCRNDGGFHLIYFVSPFSFFSVFYFPFSFVLHFRTVRVLHRLLVIHLSLLLCLSKWTRPRKTLFYFRPFINTYFFPILFVMFCLGESSSRCFWKHKTDLTHDPASSLFRIGSTQIKEISLKTIMSVWITLAMNKLSREWDTSSGFYWNRFQDDDPGGEGFYHYCLFIYLCVNWWFQGWSLIIWP